MQAVAGAATACPPRSVLHKKTKHAPPEQTKYANRGQQAYARQNVLQMCTKIYRQVYIQLLIAEVVAAGQR